MDILEYLKIPIPGNLEIGKRKLLKMADDTTEEWVQRCYEIKRHHT